MVGQVCLSTKPEIRDNFNDQNPNDPNGKSICANGFVFVIRRFGICFEFRYSDFEFCLRQLRKSRPLGLDQSRALRTRMFTELGTFQGVEPFFCEVGFMKTGLGFFLAAMVLVGNPGQAQQIVLTDPEVLNIQEQVLLPFFEGLKNGDVSLMKRHMSRDLYESNRVLLEENQEYPAFLRDYYKNISFRVVKAEREATGSGLIFHVAVETPGGSVEVHELRLSREKQDDLQYDVWAIEEF
jgi:hypothetical protein